MTRQIFEYLDAKERPIPVRKMVADLGIDAEKASHVLRKHRGAGHLTVNWIENGKVVELTFDGDSYLRRLRIRETIGFRQDAV
jgi:hypothetical protein